jgi:hypothetical protein
VVSGDDTSGSASASSVALLEPYDEFFESLLWLPDATRRAEAAHNSRSAALWSPPVANAWSPATGAWTSISTVGAAAKPKAPRTPRSLTRALIKRVGIVGLAVAVLAGGVRGAQSLSAKQIPPHPAVFDPRVLPIVSYIETETGRPFKYPIAVQFVADRQFDSLSILNDDTNSQWKKSEDTEKGFLHCSEWGSGSGACGPIQPLTQPSTEAMFLRFLGVDIPRGPVEQAQEPVLPRRRPQLYNSLTKRDIIGFYDPRTITIYVRGTDFDAVRQTVAHELVHAWQDQNGVLDGFRMGVDSEYVHLAIVEGHAEMVSGRYLATLPESNQAAVEKNDEEYGKEWTQKEKAANPQAGLATNKVNDARMVELALGFWPYEAGPKFLGSRSREQVIQLLRKPPLSTWDILNPSFDGVGRGKKLSSPSVRGARYTEQSFAIGPLFWSAGLGTVLDDNSPRLFRNAWIGDSAVLYQPTGASKVCLLDRIEFIDVASSGTAINILSHWANAHPLHSATVTAVGPTQIDVNVCA